MRPFKTTCFILALLSHAAVVQAQTIDTVAGGGPDGVPATSANLSIPSRIAIDSGGNYFISAGGLDRVFKVDPSGILTVVAGVGFRGFGGDGGPATTALLNTPSGVAMDGAGNLFIADRVNNRIRKVTAPTGIITTVAGTGGAGFFGDGGLATSARLNPDGVAVDGAGNLYIADRGNNRIRKVTASTGIITTVAGTASTASAATAGSRRVRVCGLPPTWQWMGSATSTSPTRATTVSAR